MKLAGNETSVPVSFPAQLIAKNILWDIRRFRGLADRTDDLTLVAIKIK